MAEYKETFQKWFSDILANLMQNRDAGAVLLMVSFPLLESYLRKKCQIPDSQHSLPKDSKFFTELGGLFHQLNKPEKAQDFWRVYRHGLLHLARLNRKGDRWCLDERADAVEIDSPDCFKVNPVKFAERVLQEVTSHFEVFQSGERLDIFPGGTGTVQSAQGLQYQSRLAVDDL